MSPEQQESARQERSRRERIRAERLEAFTSFRNETYQMQDAFQQAHYRIDVCGASPRRAEIVESVSIPPVVERSTFSAVSVHLTPAQIEGYLFLAKLGEIGGDPLVRGIYR